MSILESYLGPLSECFTPDIARRIVEFRPDDRTEERLEYLRERANEGLLSEAERTEYEEYVDAIDFVGLLKSQARTLLKSKRS